MALTITLVVNDGEKILAQATNELTKELHLKDFLEKTIPGFQELMKKEIAAVETEVKNIEEHPFI